MRRTAFSSLLSFSLSENSAAHDSEKYLAKVGRPLTMFATAGVFCFLEPKQKEP